MSELTSTFVDNPARGLVHSETLRVILYWALHIPLALLLRDNNTLATFHALIPLGVALFFLLRNDPPQKLLYAIGYLVGGEVFWRIRTFLIFEYVKYAVALLLVGAIFRHRKLLKISKLPLIAFVLLLPAIFLLPFFDRELISFNLSGPLVMALAVAYCSTLVLEPRHLRVLIIVMLGPLITVATNGLYTLLTAEEVVFNQVSNFAAAGGAGPNQVSALLGLGALLAFLGAVNWPERRIMRAIFVALTLGLMGQAMLTFSRGGIFTGMGAILLTAVFLLRDLRSRTIMLVGGTVLLTIFSTFLLPALDEYTSGQLLIRLQDPDPTGRNLAAQVDWQLFLNNPLYGVGPGISNEFHAELFRVTRSHTEATRLLAEHGLLGAVALFLWIVIIGRALLQPLPPRARAYRIALLAWAVVTSLHVATRVSAVGFVLGLGVVYWWSEDKDP